MSTELQKVLMYTFRIMNCRIHTDNQEIFPAHSYSGDVCFDTSRSKFKYRLTQHILLFIFQIKNFKLSKDSTWSRHYLEKTSHFPWEHFGSQVVRMVIKNKQSHVSSIWNQLVMSLKNKPANARVWTNMIVQVSCSDNGSNDLVVTLLGYSLKNRYFFI